jgi:hypothetical protein
MHDRLDIFIKELTHQLRIRAGSTNGTYDVMEAVQAAKTKLDQRDEEDESSYDAAMSDRPWE